MCLSWFHSSACAQSGRGKVVDAPEAGDEARVARRNLPERKVGELEVDGLLGKARQPQALQLLLIRWQLRGFAADRYAHQREWIGTRVVGLGDRQRDARVLQHEIG